VLRAPELGTGLQVRPPRAEGQSIPIQVVFIYVFVCADVSVTLFDREPLTNG